MEAKTRIQGRNLGAGTEAEALEDCFLQASLILLSLLSYLTQDHLPRSGTVHRELSPPISASNEENAPTCMPTGQSDEGKSSVSIPSSLNRSARQKPNRNKGTDRFYDSNELKRYL